VSLGSKFDGSFERAVYDVAGCEALVVDPTLARNDDRLRRFRERLKGAALNASVGIRGFQDDQNETQNATTSLVPIDVLLRDARVSHVSFFKADDVEGSAIMMRDLRAMCLRGEVTIDHLNLQVASRSAAHPADLADLFDAALDCQLMLFHKERNAGGCAGDACADFAWVSLRQARNIHHSCTTDPSFI